MEQARRGGGICLLRAAKLVPHNTLSSFSVRASSPQLNRYDLFEQDNENSSQCVGVPVIQASIC